MAHRIAIVGVLVVVAVGCSKSPERATAAVPTAPSAQAATTADRTPMGVGGVSGPMDVLFPSRGDSFEFRNQLEAKYQTGLNRSASTTAVDREGEVVWTQEYIRYRVNGCDHAAALARVSAQIDGNPAGAICAQNPGGLVLFPPRGETLAFRQALELKYSQLNRAASSSFVDPEGGVIWTQEYLRYRTNACDHLTSVQKVFSQIDGNGIAATCYVPPPACAYRLTPGGRDVSSAAGSDTVSLFGIPGGCTWTATSNASWLTITTATSGNTNDQLGYSFTVNQGEPRTGAIRFEWSGGSTTHQVAQAGTNFRVSVELFDPSRSVSASSVCQIRSGGAANTCNLVATANLPTAVTSYVWSATYTYGTTLRSFSQTGASNTLAITDTCGGSGSSTEGTSTELTVSLTVTDALGNTQTYSSAPGQFRMVFYTCGV